MENFIECIHCGIDFDPKEPYHAELGKINECGDCCHERGEQDTRVRAFSGFSDDGSFEGIEVVSKSEFDAYKKVEELYSED